VLDPLWFAAEGWPAVAVAGFFFGVAAVTMLWLRGPGSRPHHPPIARDHVRQFAGLLALFGTFWLVRAVSGIGGFFVVVAVLIVMSLGFVARARMRRS
jgi:hypothetical protein